MLPHHLNHTTCVDFRVGISQELQKELNLNWSKAWIIKRRIHGEPTHFMPGGDVTVDLTTTQTHLLMGAKNGREFQMKKRFHRLSLMFEWHERTSDNVASKRSIGAFFYCAKVTSVSDDNKWKNKYLVKWRNSEVFKFKSLQFLRYLYAVPKFFKCSSLG